MFISVCNLKSCLNFAVNQSRFEFMFIVARTQSRVSYYLSYINCVCASIRKYWKYLLSSNSTIRLLKMIAPLESEHLSILGVTSLARYWLSNDLHDTTQMISSYLFLEIYRLLSLYSIPHKLCHYQIIGAVKMELNLMNSKTLMNLILIKVLIYLY